MTRHAEAADAEHGRFTPEQEQMLQQVKSHFSEARRRRASAWDGVTVGRELGIPDTVICQRADISRTTLQRRLGHRPETEADE